MERDFMGLSFNDAVVLKEEYVEGEGEDSGFARSSSIPWPISDKVPALPQFMSLKCEQDEKAAKNGHSAHQVQDFKMHQSSMMSPFLKTRFGTSQNFGGGTMKQQFVGGNPVMAPQPILSPAASFAGTTDQWMNSKASPAPAQLTIFYGGAVNVFDDISPEKAQAIMFLAGNGFITTNMGQPKHPMQAPASKLAPADWTLASQSMNMSFSNIPSPLSVSSHTIDHSAKKDEVKVSKTLSRSTSIANKVEPSRVIPSMGSAAASAMISSAVPQARKASLARFLEKRKERAMSAMPYNLNNKAAECGTPESNGFGFSATSGICTDI